MSARWVVGLFWLTGCFEGIGGPAFDSADVSSDATTATEAGPLPREHAIEWRPLAAGEFDLSGVHVVDGESMSVRVPAFEMARSEVTVAQYRACVEAEACTAPGVTRWCTYWMPDRDAHPVNCVTLEHARQFASWVGGRLPSEAEWAYAARGEGDERPYPWGDAAITCEHANVPLRDGRSCDGLNTVPVCSRPLGDSPQGICDLAGNVEEWTADCWHQDLFGGPLDGSAWTDRCQMGYQVVRGGAMSTPPGAALADARRWSPLDGVWRERGIRVVRTPGAVPAPLDPPRASPATPSQPTFDWVTLSGGMFEMGVAENVDEQPVRQVTLPTFDMTRVEVTVAQYEGCVAAGNCPDPSTRGRGEDDGCNWGRPDRQALPMNCVTFEEVMAFTQWADVRLPSEAEWEYAARSRGLDRRYPWGDEIADCDRANFTPSGGRGCQGGAQTEGCALPAGRTIEGLCDMAGNVSEWVADCWHSDYTGAPTDHRPWLEDCREPNRRMERGGGAMSSERSLPVTFRRSTRDIEFQPNLGFRVARDARGAE